jgi:hypothetical protein
MNEPKNQTLNERYREIKELLKQLSRKIAAAKKKGPKF